MKLQKLGTFLMGFTLGSCMAFATNPKPVPEARVPTPLQILNGEVSWHPIWQFECQIAHDGEITVLSKSECLDLINTVQGRRTLQRGGQVIVRPVTR